MVLIDWPLQQGELQVITPCYEVQVGRYKSQEAPGFYFVLKLSQPFIKGVHGPGHLPEGDFRYACKLPTRNTGH